MKFERLHAILITLAVILLLFESNAAVADVRVGSVTVEYASNPLGIDALRPRLSWILESGDKDQVQVAYQIRVASSIPLLGSPDIWDSGKVRSNQSVLVEYGGAPLLSRTRYYWTVRVWDASGKPSEWSAPSWWEMGLLSRQDWRAQWIGHDQPTPLPTSFGKLDMPIAQKIPELLKGGDSQGQSFATDKTFSSVAIQVPTFSKTNSGMTLSLYRGGPGGELVLRQQFSNHVDNTWAKLKLPKPEGPGTYYLEESNPVGEVGWWTNKQGGYGHGRAYLNGRPLATSRSIIWEPVAGKTYEEGLSPLLRKEFNLGNGIVSARLYAAALGLYQVEINGKRVGRDLMAPGWTDYNKRIQYQTYDVTDLVSSGENALGVSLAPGWYAGNVGALGPSQYGERPYLLLQLELAYTDGHTDRIVTDGSWKSKLGPVIQADLIMGERYDARREISGWSSPKLRDSGWRSVLVKADVSASLVSQVDPPVRVEKELKPISTRRVGAKTYIYDFGQNFSGTVRLSTSGSVGQVISIRHGEVLRRDGKLYTDNLRTAKATDVFIMKGRGREIFEPLFTLHGFRYVEVSGARNSVELVGRVIHSSMPITMNFSSNVPTLNKLHSNVLWGQRSNFVSIPTDTPARDERSGWTGDIAAFVGTATYNMNSVRFLGKWLVDLRDTQSSDGVYAEAAPALEGVDRAKAGWGDAGVIVPWTLYERYGDRRVLEQNFESMARWLSYLKNNSAGYLRPADGYGDWLNLNDETPKDLIATAFFAHSAAVVAQAAEVLGKDATEYRALFSAIRSAFNSAYVESSGRIKGDTQTAYVLAISLDLIPSASQRKLAVERLVELIKARNWHLSTGFLGTPRLLSTLSENGRADVAYRLLLQTSFPSWGYQIAKGGTTMWERWDAIRPNGSFQDPGMNSFNHYAYGSVGEWMYQNVAGIRPGSPGFKIIIIKPLPEKRLCSVAGRYDSPYGPIGVRWLASNSRFDLDVEIPVNTRAQVWLPVAKGQRGQRDSARFLYSREGYSVYSVGSGRYRFSAVGATAQGRQCRGSRD
ncbi:glycoside hydrolase family 78 protein [Ralstonia insidiosa]|uniref:glycoside hydrolase family 78 protein n=2 Tax=Burkholderiaceae TaxID=119060 RepID=UPI001248D8E3|nr:glycoside hydrolase family 78 protein [Ralstonia insidiosa]KAB0472187.1 Bacterial alpha-L-rhamnosidase [Ralstonia insidiosa]MBY4908234.1 glycoside hydrolase family 78 protein [Ralstonia insidiosa]